MGLGGILQELKNEGVLALYHDYRSGTLRDWSGNGIVPVSSSGITFNKSGALFNAISAKIVVPTSATFQSGVGALVARAFSPEPVNFYLMGKNDGAGHLEMTWMFNFWGPDFTLLDTAHVDPYIASPYIGLVTNAINFNRGSAPVHYKNGVLLGNYTGNLNSSVQALANVVIGNSDSSGFNGQIGSCYQYFLWFSRMLTATEHARVYGELENTNWNTKGLTAGPFIP